MISNEKNLLVVHSGDKRRLSPLLCCVCGGECGQQWGRENVSNCLLFSFAVYYQATWQSMLRKLRANFHSNWSKCSDVQWWYNDFK